jgi:hypothetical protein
VHIAIDVNIDGDEINGHARDGGGPPKPFSGWLGLIGALDGLLASPSTGAAPPSVRMCLGFATAEEAEAFAESTGLHDAMRQAGAGGTPEIWVTQRS